MAKHIVSRKDTYFYFSYGSNMLKERIQINDPNAQPYAAARLDVRRILTLLICCLNYKFTSYQGYRLDFNYRSLRWHGAVATIVESEGSHLWGVVWIKENDTIASLDQLSYTKVVLKFCKTN